MTLQQGSDDRWYTSPQQQLAVTDAHLREATNDADQLGVAAGLIERGRCLEALWQPQLALQAYHDARQLISNEPGPWAQALLCRSCLGSAALHYAHADYALALADWQQALALAEAAGDTAMQGEALVGLGRICQVWERADAALSYNQRALAMPGMDARLQAMAVLNLVSSLNTLQRYAQMPDWLAQARSLIAAAPGEPFLAEWHMYAGIATGEAGDLAAARNHIDSALALAAGANNHWARVFCLIQQGRLQMRTRQWAEARQALELALHDAESLGLAHTLKDIHHALSQLCEAQGNIPDAFEHHKLFHQYHAWAYDGLRQQQLRDILPDALA
ncbi:hypothetical protein IGB42_02959 [Andreprevotia sp. IGB-42]|uniref:hypothetical protein n=1 Tax=Andreprevotia sp. IGB-42 TaxID=2497473 RepID=UPI001357BDCC|nr:hypothetical protein [Andreprevotia sp. IGB-42]KAF0812667.1 hypothetical protein IGB42_02959 [Andreprevotia sp. IGB-42]